MKGDDQCTATKSNGRASQSFHEQFLDCVIFCCHQDALWLPVRCSWEEQTLKRIKHPAAELRGVATVWEKTLQRFNLALKEHC
jgi:hypothetical protein